MNKKIITFLSIFKRLEIQVILSMILWILVWNYFPNEVSNFFWMWDLFMKLLKVLLWPLLFFSILVAILGLWDMKKLGSIWIRTFAYYMLTTILAISTSLILMNIFKPGKNVELFEKSLNSASEPLTLESFMLSLIPDNIIQAFVDINAMQIVIIWILLSIAILSTKNKLQINSVKNFIKWINDWILKFITWVIKLTPIWVFAIIAKVVTKNWMDSMLELLAFVIVIMLALFIHAIIILPSVWIILWKFNPLKYFLQVKKAVIVGFSTASSAATMGLSMNVAKNKAKINEDVVNFTFPIWTTINMDWTALYQAWVAIFVAQAIWTSLGFFDQILIVFIVVLASVWAAWIPWAWMIILTTVFLTIWLPIEAIMVVMAFDRILDMFRTAVNVWWDLITAKVIWNYYNDNFKTLWKKVSEKIWIK